MPAEIETAVRQIDGATLAPVVCDVLDDPAARIVDWRRERIDYANVGLESRALYRFRGSAFHHGESARWSVVLKPFRAPAGSSTAAPSDEHYYRREALAYTSGLLVDLPGDLTAPRHYGSLDWPGEMVGLWLEDISPAAHSLRPLDRYGLAARHLGVFNGGFLAPARPSSFPWLSRHALATWAAEQAGLIELIGNADAWRHSLVRQAFPTSLAPAVLRLWAERDALLAALERLPRTLCHHDASPTNLFARRTADGRDQTVAIDWELVGHGAIGEDPGNLVPVSLIDFHVDANEATHLEETVLEGYLSGLADAGWTGDPRQVRLTYATTAALRWLFAATGWPLAIAGDETGAYAADAERRWGRPIQAIFGQWAALADFLLERAAEARVLLTE